MKKIIMIVVVIFTGILNATSIVSEKFIDTLEIVESSAGGNTSIGRHGERGHLQIRQCVVDDLNNIIDRNRPKKWTLEDAENKYLARQMCRKYLEYWARKSKRKITHEHLAKIWNGGPKYWLNRNWRFQHNIQKYWSRVKKYL